MIKLEVKNKAQVLKDLDNWEAAVLKQLEALARGLATEAFVTILYNSPQYSGDFAANWKVSYGAPDKAFDEMVFGKQWGDPDPFIQGDMEAINYAIRQARGSLAGFKLGQTIFIANSAEHTHTYAWMIEGNKIKFRAGNKGEPIRITVEEMQKRYKVISKAMAGRLIEAKI